MKTANSKSEHRLIVNLSCSLISRLRANPAFKSWKKRDFIINQAQYEKVGAPTRKDHVGNWNMLCRFAARCDIEVPTKPSRKPNKTYGQKTVFAHWRMVRYEVMKRSAGRCECCGATAVTSGEPLHVDHIKPKSLHPELEFEVSNLQVLCADCNVGKGNWDETNWRKLSNENSIIDSLDATLIASYPERLH